MKTKWEKINEQKKMIHETKNTKKGIKIIKNEIINLCFPFITSFCIFFWKHFLSTNSFPFSSILCMCVISCKQSAFISRTLKGNKRKRNFQINGSESSCNYNCWVAHHVFKWNNVKEYSFLVRWLYFSIVSRIF